MIVNYTDHAANERTFLAWVRTAVAVVGFGLASARLHHPPSPVWSEVLMLVAGAVVVLVAYLRMRRLKAQIDAPEAKEEDKVPTDTLLVLLIASFFALLAVFAVHVG